MDLLDPLNPLSPISPFNPLNPLWDDSPSKKSVDSAAQGGDLTAVCSAIACVVVAFFFAIVISAMKPE